MKAHYRVIYGDTDQMGFVYNANYLRFFEKARTEFFRNTDFDYRDLEKDLQIYLPLIEAHCKYIRPAKFDDLLTISAKIVHFTPIKVKFEYEIFKDDILLATGYTVQAFMNKDGKITRLSNELYEKMKKAVEHGNREA